MLLGKTLKFLKLKDPIAKPSFLSYPIRKTQMPPHFSTLTSPTREKSKRGRGKEISVKRERERGEEAQRKKKEETRGRRERET